MGAEIARRPNKQQLQNLDTNMLKQPSQIPMKPLAEKGQSAKLQLMTDVLIPTSSIRLLYYDLPVYCNIVV